MIPDRSLEVLKAIVQEYVASKEPVGSKALVERHAFGVSAATIRNDMAILEEEELIHAPHTSAGRVPTDKGYRLFVDRLAEVKPLAVGERRAIESFLADCADLDETLSRSVRLLSQLTNQVAMVQYPSLSKASVRHIELIPATETRLLVILITDNGRIQQTVIDLGEEFDESHIASLRSRMNHAVSGALLKDVAARLKLPTSASSAVETRIEKQVLACVADLVAANRQDKILMAGAANLVRSEEDFAGSVTPVLEAIEEQVVLLKLISQMQSDQHGVGVLIGRESEVAGLQQASIVVSGYENQGAEHAKLGVIGPTRMDYSTNIGAVVAVARYLSKTLGN